MAIVRLIDEAEIAAAVEKVARDLAPAVRVIRFNLGQDWSGDPAIFFRIVLSDEASEPRRLYATTQAVEQALVRQVRVYSLDLQPYFYFRSVSEQQELKEAAWA